MIKTIYLVFVFTLKGFVMTPISSVDAPQGFLSLDFSRDIDANALVRARNEVVKMMKQQGISCVLFNFNRWRIKASASEIYQFGNSFEKSGIPGSVLFTGVIEVHDEKSKFLENVMGNRFLKTKFFSSHDEAMSWLGVQTLVRSTA